MIFEIAERFKSVQGEGLYAGTPMAFIRFVGCSVSKRVCHHCDTDFDKSFEHLGGGSWSDAQLALWVGDYEHVCLTGGEPFDQEGLPHLVQFLEDRKKMVHVETSGTIYPDWIRDVDNLFITVSPKPGYHMAMIERADEVKVIVGGLGNGPGWPTIEQAATWANMDKTVFLQPRNDKFDVNFLALRVADELVNQHPKLRLSVQLHKLLRVR